MSFNGSGTFLINSTGQPVVANTVISATVFNALTADLASGLTNCITKDGQSTPTANIPMGSNKITGLANGTLASDAANLGQVQTTAAKLIGSIAGVDTITGIMSPTLTAYAAGQLFYFIASGANTGAVTLNIDGLGAKAITRDGSTALAAGDINSGEIVVVIYDGTRFQMINAANSFGNTTINGTLTVTGKSNLAEVSTPSINASVAAVTALTATGASVASANVGTAVITSLQATGASAASINAAVALLTTATVTNLQATGASIASANIGNLQFTAASIASINAGVAVINSLTATGASIASANVGTALVTRLDVTGASAASMNANVALLTTATVTNLTATSASIASANVGTIALTRLDVDAASVASANAAVANVTDLRVAGASVTSANIGTALVTRLDVTGASAASMNANVALITTGTVTNLTSTAASIASANAGTAVVTNLTATGASIASANVGTGVVTTLTATQASVGSINAAVALVTNGTVTTLSGTQASITSINHAVVRLLGSSSGYVGLQGAAAAGSTTYTLPSADGSSGQVLSTNGSGVLSWATGGGGGSGDVVGPASATDNAITRFNLTTGKLIQNSTVILDDSGTITGVAALAAVTVSVTSANAGTATITSGNLTFSSTAQRITGDTVNATASNRLAFQNSTPNSTTSLNVIPNGTTTNTLLSLEGDSAYANGSFVQVANNPSSSNEARITSGIRGTASYMPLTIYTGGSERMRLDTSGNLGIGLTPTYKFEVLSSSSDVARFTVLNKTIDGTANLQVFTSTNQAADVGGSIALGGKNGSGGAFDPWAFGVIKGAKENATSGNLAGYLAFATANSGGSISERMRIDSSGNVGIGTASPASGVRLDVQDANAISRLTSTTGTNAIRFQLVNTGGTSTLGRESSGGGTILSGADGYSTVLNSTGAYPVIFGVNGSERMRITSGGELLVGATALATGLSGFAQIEASGTTGGIIINSATNNIGRLIFTNANTGGGEGLIRYDGSNTSMQFYTNAGERMRITSGGDVYIGSTTDLGAAAQMQIVGAEADKIAMRCSDATAGNYWRLSVDSGNTFYVQNHNAAGVYITNGGTSWTGTSDERLKTDLKPIEDSLNKVCQLRSVTGRFKTDEEGMSRSFLIAQDVLAVLPEAVDARNPEKLGVAYTDVIPLLVAAIKELSAKVAALEAK